MVMKKAKNLCFLTWSHTLTLGIKEGSLFWKIKFEEEKEGIKNYPFMCLRYIVCCCYCCW